MDSSLQTAWNTLSAFYSSGESSLGAETMQSLTIAAGVVAYAWLVGKFYHILSHREIFRMRQRMLAGEELPPGFLDYLALILKYTILFPLVALSWTVILTVSLTFLSKLPAPQIAIVSLAMVAATRVLAYLNQHTSEDVAKLLPLVLLGVVLVDPGAFDSGALLARLGELPGLIWRLAPAFGTLLLLEWGLRLGLSFKRMLFPSAEATSGDSDLDRLMKHYRPPKEED
ncbi:Uncharacterised protein [uncultured archaeon]|nr:Uncharacterised protein [uncultured archaeon]